MGGMDQQVLIIAWDKFGKQICCLVSLSVAMIDFDSSSPLVINDVVHDLLKLQIGTVLLCHRVGHKHESSSKVKLGCPLRPPFHSKLCHNSFSPVATAILGWERESHDKITLTISNNSFYASFALMLWEAPISVYFDIALRSFIPTYLFLSFYRS